MSSALAIAAVTAVLKDALNDGLLNHDLSMVGSFKVTATPPDRIVTGATEPNQLNIFLYQVTPNLAWRNAGLPSRDANGTRTANPPLALDLHYMLSAYGTDDLNSEILLGYAMQILHENPVITRDKLRTVLGAPSLVQTSILPPAFQSMSALDLADQVELIKISPVFLTTEELSKMWTAMQARYRPTMAYLVSVVLIQARAATKAAPPVLKRGKDDTGATAVATPPPVLLAVRPAASPSLPAMRLGDDLLISGLNLDTAGTLSIVLDNPAAEAQSVLTPTPSGDGTVAVHVPSLADDPNAMSEWAVGVYHVSGRTSLPNLPTWSTNELPIALAPSIAINPLNAAPGNLNLAVNCSPRILPSQEAHTQLLFGSKTVAPTSIVTPADPLQPTTLQFTIPAVTAGEYLVRLRVQGIDSVPVLIAGTPPKLEFDPSQKVKVA